MSEVMFPLVKQGTVVEYPDDKSKFKNVHVIDGSDPVLLKAEYSGSLSLDPFVPVKVYRKRITPGEAIALLKDPSSPNKGSYAKIYRAAYPQGNKAENDVALEFLEQAKFPYSEDGMIDVNDIEPALDYFLASPQNYIDQSDKDRVMQGWPLEP